MRMVDRAKKYSIGNWKMNSSLADAMVLGQGIKDAAENIKGAEIVLCPPFVWLYPMAELLKTSSNNIALGAQNMHWEDKGTFTGEISAPMLKNMVKYVILGHSERRYHFNETDEMVNDKLMQALEYGIIPIVCIGEKNRTETGDIDGLKKQLKGSLENLSKNQVKDVIIAYEPIWAISTGDTSGTRAATGEYAGMVVGKLRKYLEELYGKEVADNAVILYGGSATKENISEYMAECEIDGVLVGGASLKIDNFIQICKVVGEYR